MAWRFRIALAGLLATGCTTGLGPRVIHGERPDYNQQIARSADQEMLLNLVRLRYNDSPLFLELGAVVAQYTYDAALSAGGNVNGMGTFGLLNILFSLQSVSTKGGAPC